MDGFCNIWAQTSQMPTGVHALNFASNVSKLEVFEFSNAAVCGFMKVFSSTKQLA